MKLLDIDWVDFFTLLPRWEALAVEAKRKYLDHARPSAAIPNEEFGGALQSLLDSGLLASVANGRKAQATPGAGQEFCRAMRFMDRVRIFAAPGPDSLRAYLQETTTHSQRLALIPRSFSQQSNDREFHAVITQEDWVKEFLATQTTQWEAKHQAEDEPAFLQSQTVLKATQGILKRLLERGQPVALREILNWNVAANIENLSKGVAAGLQFLMWYAALARDTLNPVIGVYPTIAARHHAAAQEPPQPVTEAVGQEFSAPFLVEDLTAILAAFAAEPPRLKADGRELYAKATQELEALLTPVPGWLERTTSMTAGRRLSLALLFLAETGFATDRGTPGTDLRLEATEEGLQWLALRPGERIKQLYDQLTTVPKRVESGYYLTDTSLFLPYQASYTVSGKTTSLREAVRKAYAMLPPEGYVRLGDFLRYQRVNRNPLFAAKSTQGYTVFAIGSYYSHAPLEAELEAVWENLLASFYAQRLVPLGAVRVGLNSKQEVCVELTASGRYLLGLTKDLALTDEQASGAVIVQPNFEVTFLAPAPLAEAEIGRFAERRGRQVGTLFRLTKQSVLRAAATGMAADEALDALRKATSMPIPGNVERELRGWFALTRTVTMRPAVLVTCPDAETAKRVVTMAGGKSTIITDTVVELDPATNTTTLTRKLKEAGVVVRGSAHPPEKGKVRRAGY